MNTVKLYKLLLALLILVSFSVSQVTGLSDWDIWLDAGHSRDENMGIYGYSEARRNLRVALNIEDLLLTLTDIDTVGMTRRNDQVSVGLTERCNMANNWGASWFHSLHSDASSMGSSANSTLLLWGQLANGNPDPPVGGEAMSDLMIDLLTRAMRTYTVYGSIGDCSFYGCSGTGPYLAVNRLTNMPSELSEAGFHTNPRQNQLNMNEEWKRMEAWTFFWSILKFHNIPRPTVGILAGIISDLESEVPINGAVVTVNGQAYTTDTYASLFNQYSNDPDQLHNGYYYFEDLPNTALEVIVTAPNYYPDTLTVTPLDTFITFRDFELVSSLPPYVAASVPAAGDTNFSAMEEIEIDFSREMDPVSTEASFSISPPISGSLSWTHSNNTLIFNPDELEYNTYYQVTIGESAQDVYGHFFDGDNDGIAGGVFQLQFRTEPVDIYAPEIVYHYPRTSASNIELKPLINFNFNEIIQTDTQISDYFRLEQISDNSYPDIRIDHYQVNNRSSINIFPYEYLNASEVHVTRVLAGIKDLTGNEVTFNRSYSFLTGSTGLQITSIDDFEGDLTTRWWAPGSSGSTTGITATGNSRAENDSIVNHLTGSNSSLELNYSWDPAATSWLIREHLSGGAPRDVTFNDTWILQVYIFGDGSGNQFRFCVDDNTNFGGHEVSIWYTIDWIGWKLVSWDLAAGETGTWIGDGVLNGTLRYDSIQLTWVPGNPATGQLFFDDLRIVQETVAGVDEMTTTIPSGFTLAQNYPNPFNPVTRIDYTIPAFAFTNLSVYDLNGKLVRTLVNNTKSPGEYSVIWNGKNDNGIPVASGVYLYRLSSADFSQSRRMLYIK